MKLTTKHLVVYAVAAVVLPVTSLLALSRPTAKVLDGPGVCTDLGCIGGNIKCATGTLNLPDGASATFTCYTLWIYFPN